MSKRSQAPDDTPVAIGRYEVTGTLGFGAMGAVYRAFDPIIKRPLAIKTIRLDVPRQSPQYATFKARFYQEARICGTLSHPNIVTVFDIGEDRDVPFLAMEYVEGQVLSALLEQGVRFAPERAVTLIGQVASALDYAHSRGVVHRDIKPSNLIVQEGDHVKVTDFGIAKLVDQEITQTGSLLGTPSYMSPEQAMGESIDGRSDIFSLGVCAFEMLSGVQPFPGSNVTSILYRLVHVDPIDPAHLEASGLMPQRWREVFHRVLAKRPDDRYQKAGEFVEALEGCLRGRATDPGEATVALEEPGRAAVERPPGSASQSRGAADEETLVLEPSLGGAETGPTAILPTPAVPSVAPPPPTARMEAPAGWTTTLPPEPREAVVGEPPPPPERRSLPMGWLLGGAAALFVLAAALVGWMLSSRAPEPSVEAPATTAPTVPAAERPTTGTLVVESEPAGALVTIDGEPRGETPLEAAEIPLGEHEVLLALKGYGRQSHDVTLSAESPVGRVRATLSRRPTSGTASVVSTPPGATVFVDGRRVGTTPLDGLRLGSGPHDVSLALEGYERWSGLVEVKAGRRSRVEGELRPSAPPTPPPVDTTRVYENKTGQVDHPARKKSGASPPYPTGRAPRLKSGERVSVTLRFVVTDAGRVEDVEVVESAGSVIDDVVMEAVRSWEYEPATIRGTPVRARVLFKQTFLGG